MFKIKISKLSSGRFLILGYLLVISIGTFFLLLPISTVEGEVTSFIDALFTATSATAVTGLITLNTMEHWTRFGQTVIMLLIQIGGFGFMTSTTLLFLIFGKRVSLRERLIIMEDLNYNKISGAISLSKYIIILTFTTEALGALLLFLYFKKIMPSARAVYFAVFHAISAFNNAGFDLFGNSLLDFVNIPYINIVITFLFIIGGIGFIVIDEVFSKGLKNLSLHSRLVLNTSLILIILGTFSFFFLEYTNPATIGNLSLKGKLLGSYFQGVTPRTAGFNTIPIERLRDVTLFIIILFMFIGASPGSTGGGVKTTTIVTLLIVIYNMSVGKEDIEAFGRRFRDKDIYKALTVVVISLLLITVVTIVLSSTEKFSFIQIIFEVFSAFGTVGLSTGITARLSNIGKLFIIFTMFVGRVGPVTLAVALGRREYKKIRYPAEDILIG
ncbi:TrkH family potassium uptake protein [Halocella sp. SP3-1]|uniref:TrkH family potassium uptake protein n=1 Tax=Halocella sp. SP3-1 TaxID=2382161 RepID=UPI0025709EFD|nr:TrkH family potassium uptake protein [Halocella sp. SP3-1]